MSPFWNSLFDHLRGCGRNATIFMLALAGFFGLLIAAATIYQTRIWQYVVPALPAIGLVWACKAIQRARRPERLQRSPLSCDELRVARSKLVKARNAKSL